MFKAPNQNPTDVWRENLSLNASSFNQSGHWSDFWPEMNHITAGNANKGTWQADTTAYATPVSNTDWGSRLKGWINRGLSIFGGNLS
jgi:hypothetical protein